MTLPRGQYRSLLASLSLCTLLALAASGCSFAFVRGPPDRPIALDAKLECSTSRSAPVADLAAGIGSFVLAGVLQNLPQRSPPNINPVEGSEIAPVFVGLGVVWVASSLFGFVKSNSCLDAMKAQRACFAGQAEACRLLQEAAPPTSPP
jgi:hypothetical protein